MLDEERQYVQLAKSGDNAGFSALYQLHADRLYRQVIYPCLPNEASAEDVLRETFVTVMEKIHNYQWDSRYGIFPWLARIARNRALDMHRKATREGRFQGAYRQELDAMARPGRSPDQIIEQKQEEVILKESVKECLEKLNPRYRMAVQLRMFQELSREECAERLGIQVSTFDVLFHRALRSFKKLWQQGTS